MTSLADSEPVEEADPEPPLRLSGANDLESGAAGPGAGRPGSLARRWLDRAQASKNHRVVDFRQQPQPLT